MLDNVPSFFTSDFMYLLASLKVFIKSYEGELFECPFNIEHICKLKKTIIVVPTVFITILLLDIKIVC